MGKELNVLSHSTLNSSTSAKESTVLPNFSAFVVDLKAEPDFEYSLFEQNFRFDFFSVVYVSRGAIVARVNFREVNIEKGSLFITTPNCINQILSISEDCVIEGLNFTSDFLKKLNQPNNFLDMMEFFSSKYDPLWRLSPEEEKRFSGLIRELQLKTELIGKHVHGKEILHAFFTIFLYEMADIGVNRATMTNMNYGRKEDLVLRFARLAQAHCLQERNLSFYSNQLCVTSKYLSETVKEITGVTAGQQINELVALEAKRLLENSALTISEVAFELHFSTPAFFSKFFKRLTGMNPREYRMSLFNNE